MEEVLGGVGVGTASADGLASLERAERRRGGGGRQPPRPLELDRDRKIFGKVHEAYSEQAQSENVLRHERRYVTAANTWSGKLVDSDGDLVVKA